MKLQQILEQQELTLSSMQKYIIVVIHTSQTPVLAFDRIMDTQSDKISSEFLDRYGFIKLYQGQAELTERGRQALISYGLVDDAGEVTEIGQSLVDSYEDE